MYFLGVDGGNTKTEYMLCSTDGTVVDVYRAGTCSHERFDDGFDGMESAMGGQLEELYKRNKISVGHIAAAGFGLAGADLPWQTEELKARVAKLGFNKFDVANDAILGIKVTDGIGISAVNGTGTAVIGADINGEILLVGGVGSVSGDGGGGMYIRDKLMAALYSRYYRCGIDSPMFPRLMQLLDVKVKDLFSAVCDWDLLQKNMNDIIAIGADTAKNECPIARKIFDDVGRNIGMSVAGCIKCLNFEGLGIYSAPISVVLIGSIWHKISYQGMTEVFLETAQSLSGKICRVVKTEAPPSAGGVLWAKEIADGAVPSAEYRQKFLGNLSAE